MGRQLCGFLTALWLLAGAADAAQATRPRISTPAATPAKPRAKAKKKPQTTRRITGKKTTRARFVLPKTSHKSRKKLRREAPPKPLKKRTKRVARIPRRYIRSFSALVTAYVPLETPMEGGRWTCTMRDGWRTHGIAVDPKYIPLGSLLYVPGYGKALADDTGGRIKGRHIDIRHHSVESMNQWGVKRMRVYILKHPKKKRRAARLLSV